MIRSHPQGDELNPAPETTVEPFLRVVRARGRRSQACCALSSDKLVSGRLALAHIESELLDLVPVPVLAVEPGAGGLGVRPGLCRTSALHLIG